jgi:hypothetical protein
MDLISKKTRSEFQEYLVSMTLREIARYFDNHDVPFAQLPPEKMPSGQRRGLVSNYYESINWTDSKHVKKILNVYADILQDISSKVDSGNQEVYNQSHDKLVKLLNRDGYQYENGKISTTGQVADFDYLQNATDLLDKGHFQEYINRIKKSINEDPGLAIGSTKELVESTLKTILTELKSTFEKDDDVPKLLKQVQKALDLVPDQVDDAKKGAEIIKVLLSNLGQVVIKLTELRNLYGTGHGLERKRKGLSDRHARLAVGAGITLSTFLLETFELKRTK